MDGDERIRLAQNRVIETFTQRPEAVHSTNHSVARLTDGLVCTIEEAGRTVQADMKPTMGGEGSAPAPGFYARAAITSCVAIGIKSWAAREGVALRAITVTLDTDFDDGAMFGLGTSPAGPLQCRIAIELDTDAAPDVVRSLIARALEADPWFLGLRDAQKVTTDVVIGEGSPVGARNETHKAAAAPFAQLPANTTFPFPQTPPRS